MPAAGAAALHELAADCAAYPDAVRAAIQPAVGTMMTDAATAAAATVGSRLSRYNRGAGALLTATAAPVGRDLVRLTPRPLGPWTIVESGSHRSTWIQGAPPRKGKGGPKRIAMANGDVRWYVRHRGVAGRGVWSDALSTIEARLPDTVHEAAVKAWDGLR